LLLLFLGGGEWVCLHCLLACSFWFRSEVVDPGLITGHNWVQKFGSFSLL
jgi:hypothetical protein